MARVQAPLLSLSASGTIGNAITYSTWKGRPYVRTRVIPANPRSGLQVGMRAGVTFAPGGWNLWLGSANRTLWNEAVGSEAISGFNLFTRVGQRSIRNNYGYIMSTTDQDQSSTPAAPAGPGAAQDGTDMDLTWTDEVAAFGVLIFHSLTTPFTPGISNLVAVIRNTVELWTDRNPGIATHYYDIRSMGIDGGVGALAGEFSGVIS